MIDPISASAARTQLQNRKNYLQIVCPRQYDLTIEESLLIGALLRAEYMADVRKQRDAKREKRGLPRQCSSSRYITDDRFFQATYEYLLNSMLFSTAKKLRSTFASLRDKKVIETKLIGMPATQWVRLDLNNISLRASKGYEDDDFEEDEETEALSCVKNDTTRCVKKDTTSCVKKDTLNRISLKRIASISKEILPTSQKCADSVSTTHTTKEIFEDDQPKIKKTASSQEQKEDLTKEIELLQRMKSHGDFRTRISADKPTKLVLQAAAAVKQLMNGSFFSSYNWNPIWLTAAQISAKGTDTSYASHDELWDKLLLPAITDLNANRANTLLYKHDCLLHFFASELSQAHAQRGYYQSNLLHILNAGARNIDAVRVEKARAQLDQQTLDLLDSYIAEWKRSCKAAAEMTLAQTAKFWEQIRRFAAWYASNAVKLAAANRASAYQSYFASLRSAVRTIRNWAEDMNGDNLWLFGFPDPGQNKAWKSLCSYLNSADYDHIILEICEADIDAAEQAEQDDLRSELQELISESRERLRERQSEFGEYDDIALHALADVVYRLRIPRHTKLLTLYKKELFAATTEHDRANHALTAARSFYSETFESE